MLQAHTLQWSKHSVQPMRNQATLHPKNVEQLIEVVGSCQDLKQYRALYNDGNPKYAVVKVGGEVIQKELSVLVDGLGFLKNVGLFPIIVHGAGPQLNSYLNKNFNYEPQYNQGQRITDSYVLQAARKVFLDTNLKLVNALQEAKQPAVSVAGGLFDCVQMNPEIGLVGKVTHINRGMLDTYIAENLIPVIPPLGESDKGQIMNINADVAAREIAKCIKPHKIIFLNAKGGWIEDDGTKLTKMDLTSDFDRYMARNWIGRQGQLLKLKELKHILEFLPPGGTIALTSARGLMQEVFAHRSEGTQIL